MQISAPTLWPTAEEESAGLGTCNQDPSIHINRRDAPCAMLHHSRVSPGIFKHNLSNRSQPAIAGRWVSNWNFGSSLPVPEAFDIAGLLTLQGGFVLHSSRRDGSLVRLRACRSRLVRAVQRVPHNGSEISSFPRRGKNHSWARRGADSLFRPKPQALRYGRMNFSTSWN
jgi:hypothetical protein